MRKKFVKVMLFGALALTVSASFVGCTDYDDDIKNLQEQIDNINKKEPGVTTAEMSTAVSSAISALKTELKAVIAGKADNAAVVALQDKVRELEAALNNKADASAIQELIAQIGELSEEVNSVKGSLEDSKTKLEAEIKALEDELANVADAAEMEELAKKLTEAQNQLKELEEKISDNAGEIVKLTTQIGQLAEIQASIEALQTSNQAFQTAIDELKAAQGNNITEADLSKALQAYLTKDEIAKLLDNKMLDYLTKEDYAKKEQAIYDYVNNTLTANIMAKVNAAYVSLDKYNKDLKEINEKFSRYVDSESSEYKKLVSDVTALNNYKTETLQALVDLVNGTSDKEGLSKQVADLVAAMGEITDLSQTLSGYVKSTELTNYVKEADLNDKIEAYLSESMESAESTMQTLEKRLEALEIGVKAMIQSIVYAPQTVGGVVAFNSLEVEDTGVTPNKNVVVAEDKSLNISFRVSPVSAAKVFFDKYDYSFEGHEVASRAAGKIEYLNVESSSVDEATGMVNFVVSTGISAGKSYAICMHVTPKAKVGEVDNDDNLTDITSNYFVVSKSLTKIETIVLESPAKAENTLYYNNENSAINYAEGIKYVINGGHVNLENYDMSKFSIEYSVTNENYFSIGKAEGILKPANYNLASYVDQTATATATVKIEGVKRTFPTSFAAVTIKEETSIAETTCDYGTLEVAWKNAEQTIPASKFDLTKIYDEANITATAFKQLTASYDETADVHFVVGTDNVLSVAIAANTAGGEHPIQVIFEGNGKKITVKANVKITYNEVSLTTKPELWEGDKMNGTVIFTPTLDDQFRPSTIALSMDLTTLFGNYTEVYNDVTAAGGTVTLNVQDLAGFNGAVSFENNVVTINPSKYSGKDIVITSDVKFGNTTVDASKATIKVVNVSGTWKPGKLEVTLTDKAAKINVLEGFSWIDFRNKVMWADGADVEGGTDFADGVKGLAVYGLTAPTCTLTAADGTECPYLKFENGEVYFTEAGKTFGFVQPYEAKVTINVTSPWGEIAGATPSNTEILITIPALVQ